MLELDLETLCHILDYDPVTGKFIWKISPRPRTPVGAEAGTINNNGYRNIMYKGQNYQAHRLAWAIMTGSYPNNLIDHINRNPSDNRFSNLREISKRGNSLNSSRADETTHGVSLIRGKYNVYFHIKGTTKYFGRFENKEEAINKANQVKEELGLK